MANYLVGVDVGGTTVKIGLFTIQGETVDKWEIVTRKDEGGAYILSDISASIDEKLAAAGIAKSDVEGIGMGVPGPVKSDGTVLKCANLGWGVFNVEAELSKLSGLPVKAGNDANMAALGEVWQGGGKGYKNAVMVTLGTGVGGGIIIEGKMIAGTNGAAGEIGHILVDETETEVCGCGNKGCLEQYTSATGVVRLARRHLAANDSASVLRGTDITAKAVFDAAKEGDEAANAVVAKSGLILGKALAQIAATVDPEVFIIGGGVSRAGDILTNAISSNFEKYAFHACKGTKFVLATLGNDAGMYGGASLILGN